MVSLSYAAMVGEERALVREFGAAYRGYVGYVPRANAIAGVTRLRRRRSAGVR